MTHPCSCSVPGHYIVSVSVCLRLRTSLLTSVSVQFDLCNPTWQHWCHTKCGQLVKQNTLCCHVCKLLLGPIIPSWWSHLSGDLMNFMKRTEQLKRVTEVASSCPVEQKFFIIFSDCSSIVIRITFKYLKHLKYSYDIV